MSNRLLVPRSRRLAAPALIFPRRVLYYRGRRNGPADFVGRMLVEGRSGREWVDIQALLDGGWDGQPATAILGVTHLIGFGVSESRVVVPGSQTWTANDTHVVSDYDRLEVAVWGGGASGGGVDLDSSGNWDGSAGRASSYGSSTPVAANADSGGGQGITNTSSNGTGGAGGTASGGDTNTSGDAGATGTTSSGKGGDGADGTGTLLGTLTGGAGGAARGTTGAGNAGTAPGGGGGGAKNGNGDCGGGGGGALAIKLWLGVGASGAPAVGASITVTVGTVRNGSGDDNLGGQGARGEVRAQWD